jgi:tripartite-type tricarboxylate transporter receptor subunit TctC
MGLVGRRLLTSTPTDEKVRAVKSRGGIRMNCARAATAILLAGFACGQPLAGQAAGAFYKNKVLTIISSDVGGGIDAYARLVGRHIVNYLPGNPVAVVEAMPGASGLLAANYIHRQATADGTFISMPLTTAMFAPLFGDPGARFKSDQFTWVGSLDQATDTCDYWKGSGVSSFADLFQKSVTFAADAPAGVGSQFPRAMNALLGTKAQVIQGYSGTAGVAVAMRQKEVQASCVFMVSSLTSMFRSAYESGELVPFVQFARKSELLPHVPYIMDYARTAEDKDVFKLVFMRDALSRAIVAPPNISDERKKDLRSAFDQMVKDPAFLADAAKLGLPIDPMSGQQDDAFVHDMMSVPPEAVARANDALQSGLGDVRKSNGGSAVR